MKKTTTEAELRRLVSAGKTHGEIAKMLGRSAPAVAAACNVLGVRSPLGVGALHGAHPHDLQSYMNDLRNGLTIREIAEKNGRKHSAVCIALKRAGLPTCARLLLKAESEQSKSTTYTADRFASFVQPLAS